MIWEKKQEEVRYDVKQEEMEEGKRLIKEKRKREKKDKN